MKICLWMSEYYEGFSGVHRMTTTLANHLAKEHEVTVVYHDAAWGEKPTVHPEFYLASTIDKIPLNDSFFRSEKRIWRRGLRWLNRQTGCFNHSTTVGILRNIILPRNVRRNLITFFNHQDFDIIIGVHYETMRYLSAIAPALQAHTIGWLHNSFEACWRNPPRYLWQQDQLARVDYPNLDKLIVLSAGDQQKLAQYLGLKSSYIHNPVSFQVATPVDLTHAKFIAMGRFSMAKRYDRLLAAFSYFNQYQSDWQCLLLGDGPERFHIEQLVRQYGLEKKVIMPGFVSDVRSYFQQASIYLLTSQWEGLPLVVLEALAVGCPVIAYDLPTLAPLLSNEKEGLLVPQTASSEEYGRAMLRLARDPQLRQVMQANALVKAQQFTPEKFYHQWDVVVDQVMQNNMVKR
ncbi:glycosyltransferase [Ligilactobacillus saerimneri]|uniref:glycosyltransferase n=1 Tax=Ligilactobacillus saerimneri TaxID=228229 RepID=UPI0024B238D0|nr:glycosyltransferase [Ligilactobacillus saerimneri]MDI9205538.1 glycosyltransferase [Ligilactobacillus saerimneri]